MASRKTVFENFAVRSASSPDSDGDRPESRTQGGAAPGERVRTGLERLGLSCRRGDVRLLDGGWYVTHSGLLRLAARRRCAGIAVEAVPEFSDPAARRWAFKATAYTSATCRGFVGFGDADPSNVSVLVRGAELRVAETRAVNRALRKAYGIGICSVEELGSTPTPPSGATDVHEASSSPALRTESSGQHRLRDRLCLLVRQHRLDAARVKAFAADYCEVAELKQARPDKVANFIEYLGEYAVNDREGLLCRLNSYTVSTVTPAEPETRPPDDSSAQRRQPSSTPDRSGKSEVA